MADRALFGGLGGAHSVVASMFFPVGHGAVVVGSRSVCRWKESRGARWDSSHHVIQFDNEALRALARACNAGGVQQCGSRGRATTARQLNRHRGKEATLLQPLQV